MDRLIVKRIFDKYDILNIQLTNFSELDNFLGWLTTNGLNKEDINFHLIGLDEKLTTQENVPLKPLSLTYQTLRPFMASTGKLMSGPCLLQKLEKLWELTLNIFTICLLSDWGGVCLCVESAPLGALVGVIVRNVEWVTGEHYLSAVSCQLRGEGKY